MTQKTDQRQKQQVEFRAAPYSQEAEQAVIGAALIDSAVYIDLAANDLRAEDFYFLRHVFIWSAIGRIALRNAAVDFVTITEELRAHNQLDEVGGTAYLLSLANNTPSSMHAKSYAALVKRAAMRRTMLNALDAMRELVMDETLTTEAIQAQADQVWRTSTTRRIDTPDSTISSYANKVFAQIEAQYTGAMVAAVLPTGLTQKVDGKLVPITVRRGEVTILAGASKFGKSSFVVGTVGLNVVRAGRTVVIFSNEETDEDVTRRIACAEAGANLQTVSSGVIGDSSWSNLVQAFGKIDSWTNMHIVYMPDMTPKAISRELDRIGAEFALDLVIIDGMKSIEADPVVTAGGKVMQETRSRTQQMKAIMKDLTAMAATRNIAILAAHHFNRDEDGQSATPPKFTNLAESSALEQYAQTIWALWRPPASANTFDEQEDGTRPTTLISVARRFTMHVETQMLFNPNGNYYMTDERPRQLVDLRSEKKRSKEEPF